MVGDPNRAQDMHLPLNQGLLQAPLPVRDQLVRIRVNVRVVYGENLMPMGLLPASSQRAYVGQMSG